MRRLGKHKPFAVYELNGHQPDGSASAALVGLRYVTDAAPGIARRGTKTFTYWYPSGRRVREAATLARIRSLVIPPAWKDVWICTHADGHVQATGRDARGRKQYRYHPRWIEIRDEIKYGRILDFARVLPIVRRQTRKDLRLPSLSRQRVIAIVVTLLEKTLIRVGNEEYARTNGSFGLTTLQDRHAQVHGRRVRFRFRGKSRVFQQVELDNPQLAKSVRRCQELPGQTLFQYIDADGARQAIDSADVNAYVRGITGRDFTAKDFRTWSGTVLAASALAELGRLESATSRKKTLVRAIEAVAQRLGNTKAVCRKCYVHPAILEAYLDEGATIAWIGRKQATSGEGTTRLSKQEQAVVALLKRRLRPMRRQAREPSVRRSRAGYRAARVSAAAR